MKCPKCGYLGFETTDRCRNCQYDFSLAPFKTEAELTLQDADRSPDAITDFDLKSSRYSDAVPSSLDLDRLFGDPDPATGRLQGDAEPDAPSITVIEDASEFIEVTPDVDADGDEPRAAGLAMTLSESSTEEDDETAHGSDGEQSESALPFEDSPIVPPPAARPPLAVRRSTGEVPRNRPRTTRPVRMEPLELEAPKTAEVSRAATETVASLMESPALPVRIGAGAIDLALLVGIDLAVVYLTLRVTGLENTLTDLRVLPRVPFVGFLALLAFGYVAAFTVAGGQTIGKMVLSLRVIGDDGRPVDAAGGMIRALGCMLVPVTLGLSYLPALFTSDRRALHDRLAGTRVVQE